MVASGISITVVMGTNALKPMLNSGTRNGPIRENGISETAELYDGMAGRS